MNKKQVWTGNIALILTAFIWGTAFVAQSKGMDFLAAFSFNGLRSFIAVIVLSFLLLFLYFKNKNKEGFKLIKNKKVIWGSIICGLALFFSTSLQQIAIGMTTVGKAGFLTSLYIIIVPILGLFFKKKVSSKIWLCVGLSVVGLYLLCFKANFTIELGDILLILAAAGFAVQILIVDYITKDINPILLSIIQFLVVGILSLFPTLIIEKPTLVNTFDAMPYLLFAEVLSSGVAYTLQIIGQKHTSPTVASLILSLESVFAALTAWLFLDEEMMFKEYIGCLFIFSAIILSQLNFKKKAN